MHILDYDAEEFPRMDDGPKMMFRLHLLVEKERAHAT